MEKTDLRIRGIAHAAMAFVFAMLLAFSTAGAAWAASPDEAKDSAGNVFASAEDYTSPSENKIDRDFYWAGKDLDLASTETGGDIVIAGMNLGVSDSKAGGSVRAAGMNLTFTNVSSGSNFTVAGQDIHLVDCAAEGGVYCAGSTISFSGSAAGGSFAAGKVVFNGTIDGDASIYADAVEIGPNAVVTGTLHVGSGVEPVIPESAQIGALEFEKTVDDTSVDEAEAAGVVTFIDVLMKILGVVGTVLFALALAWLFRRPVEGATAMTRSHAGRMFATGAIALVASPLLFVLLLCLMITSPIALALLFALVVLAMVAVPFAAASLSRLALPRMNRFGAAAIGGAVLGIASILPFLGVLVSLVAFIYVLGYVVQVVWSARRPSSDDAASNESSNGPSEAGAPAVLGSSVVTLPSESKGDGPQHAADQQRRI